MFDVNVNRIENGNLTKQTRENYKSNYTEEASPNAFYIGIVTNTNDVYKIGRVQVRVPALHGTNTNQNIYISDSSLPWARPAILNGAGNDMGQFIVPTKGSVVVVSFEYNDFSKPLYFGGIPTLGSTNSPKNYNDNDYIFGGNNLEITTNDRIKDLKTNSAQQVVYKSLKGATIIIDETDGKESLKIIDASGQQIIMGNDSAEALPRRGDSTNPPETAYIKIISGGTITVDCNEFQLDCETTNIHDDYCTD